MKEESRKGLMGVTKSIGPKIKEREEIKVKIQIRRVAQLEAKNNYVCKADIDDKCYPY